MSALECVLRDKPWMKSVKVGEGFSLHWCIWKPGGIQDCEIQLLIERLDGLLIVNERFKCEGAQFALVKVEQEVDIPPMLAYGVYRVQVTVFRKDMKLARRSSVLEVVNPTPPKGGRPALSYPYTVCTS